MGRRSIAILVLLLAVGFAAVSTMLVINGGINIAFNQNNFDVFFSKVFEDGKENPSLITDKTHINFGINLSLVGDKYTLDYEVTNGSNSYDVNFEIKYTGENSDVFSIKNIIDTNNPLKARTSRNGRIIIELLKPLTESKDFNIGFEIIGTPISRDEEINDGISIGNHLMKAEPYNVDELEIEDPSDNNSLAAAVYKGTMYLGHEIDRTKIEKVKFLDSKTVPDGVLDSWDVSDAQNGSVLVYTMDEDNNSLLELYIGQDGGVIANPDSSCLFLFLDALTEVSGLENFNTQYVTNMEDMFVYCRSLEYLDLDTFNTSNVTNFNTMFSFCLKLKSVNLSSFNTKKSTKMIGMFNKCTCLEELDLGNFDTSNVTDMSGMFQQCENLAKLNISSFNTQNVELLQAMFNFCTSLKELDLSNFDTSNIQDMSYMLAECKSLTELNLSNFDTSQVINMEGMFWDSSNIIELDISNFNTTNVQDMAYMFQGCTNLNELYLGRLDINNQASTDYIFRYDLNQIKIYIKDIATKDWILGMTSTARPTAWGDENFILNA